MFPSAVTQTGADGKRQTSIQPVKDGSDVQSNFFDMWRQEHPEADLQDVPGDLVMASSSGLQATVHHSALWSG
jgi:K+-transporting ATPase ATPase C chain